jgi:hypothetical protein
VNTTFFPLYSPLLRTPFPSSHHGVFFQQREREHLAPLHSLAQLVPSTSPPTGPGREDEGKYILLTSLEPDAWFVHVGRPDGRWWKGALRVSDMEKLAVCPSTPFPPRVVADVLCIMRSKSGDILSARVGAFAQRVARTIVQREVAVAHEGVDFRNMKVGSSSPSSTPWLTFLLSLLARAWYSDQKPYSDCFQRAR